MVPHDRPYLCHLRSIKAILNLGPLENYVTTMSQIVFLYKTYESLFKYVLVLQSGLADVFENIQYGIRDAATDSSNRVNRRATVGEPQSLVLFDAFVVRRD